MQTLLNVTNANVCASMQLARSFLAKVRGMATTLRKSCGMNASDSNFSFDGDAAGELLRYSTVEYGEKLWRWSIRVRWWRYVWRTKGYP